MITGAQIRFDQIRTPEEWRALGRFRLNMYQKSNLYMLNELDADGFDEFDKHSLVFAAWQGDKIVATTRLTPYPFETINYIDNEKLSEFLGQSYRDEYLEWSRLIVDSVPKLPKLLSELIVYAGLIAMSKTSYTRYFGYTKPVVQRLLSGFMIAEDRMRFTIPGRGDHAYCLIKGKFINDYNQLK
jgi:N-acyl-L-homoserine lactone synthetase